MSPIIRYYGIKDPVNYKDREARFARPVLRAASRPDMGRFAAHSSPLRGSNLEARFSRTTLRASHSTARLCSRNHYLYQFIESQLLTYPLVRIHGIFVVIHSVFYFIYFIYE